MGCNAEVWRTNAAGWTHRREGGNSGLDSCTNMNISVEITTK